MPLAFKSGSLGSQSAFISVNVFRPLQGGSLAIGIKAENNDHVTVKIFNLSGQLVRPVQELDISQGQIYSCNWDGKNEQGETVASGIYFVSVHGAHQHSIKKVVVLK